MGPKLEPCSEAQSPHLKLDGPPGVVQPKTDKAIQATNAAIQRRGRRDMKITMVRSFLICMKTAFAWPRDTGDTPPTIKPQRREGMAESAAAVNIGSAEKSRRIVSTTSPAVKSSMHGRTNGCLSQQSQRHLPATQLGPTLPIAE